MYYSRIRVIRYLFSSQKCSIFAGDKIPKEAFPATLKRRIASRGMADAPKDSTGPCPWDEKTQEHHNVKWREGFSINQRLKREQYGGIEGGGGTGPSITKQESYTLPALILPG